MTDQAPFSEHKIKWRCRRGVLELDVMLQHFHQLIFPGLNSDDQTAFVDLLSCSDDDLINWLVQINTEPEELKLLHIVQQIRAVELPNRV